MDMTAGQISKSTIIVYPNSTNKSGKVKGKSILDSDTSNVSIKVHSQI